MRKNILSTLVLLGAGAMLTACDSEQPRAGCIVQDSAGTLNWWAKYDQVEAPTAVVPGATCGAAQAAPAGEILGVYKFYDPTTDKAALTIKPTGLASLGKDDPNNAWEDLQLTGDLTTDTDAEDFCTANNFTVGKVHTTAAATPTQITYEFDTIRVYSSPGAPGTQMTGELTYTKDGCRSTYVMRAIWPNAHCDPEADPADPEQAIDACGAGSGINPDFDVVCDAETEYCVPAGPIPSFK